MRIAPIISSLALLVGCHSNEADRGSQTAGGWEFRPAHGGYNVGLTYDFNDGEGTKLAGTCNGAPSFFVKGGAYEWGQRDFVLTVDGKSWSLPIMEGAPEGRFLSVDSYEPQRAMTNAKSLIAFQVGNWRREIRPSPLLHQFAQDCR